MNKLNSYKAIFITLLVLLSLIKVNAQAPVINSFSPSSANIGSTVTITGTGFDATAINNIVFFGASKATVTSASPTSLTVTVPGGAGYQNISVTVNGLTAYSSLKFSTSFGGADLSQQNSFELSQLGFPVAATPGSWAIADLDGDGKPDIGAYDDINYPPVGILTDTISIFRNTSVNGTFSYDPEFKLQILWPEESASVFFKDIDGDGKPEVLIFGSNEHLLVYRNTCTPGTLSFDPPVTINWSKPQDVIFGDFDNDGKTDIGLINNTYLGIFLNSSTPGNISFNLAEAYSNTAVTKIITADIDEDGKLDLVVSEENTLHVLRNTGSPGSVSFSSTDLSLLSAPKNLFIGDLDGDQKEDIASLESNGFSVFKNMSTPGTFTFASRDDKTINGYNANATYNFTDLDGDAKPDLVGKVKFDSMGIFKNTGTAGNISFDSYFAYASLPGASFGTDLFGFADLNADGKSDILILQAYDFLNTVAYIRNRAGDPRITSFTPRRAFGDTTILISGFGFSAATAVSVGSTPAISFNILSPTTISAVIPAGAAGNVIVTTLYGVASLEVFNTPFISSFSPYLAGPGSADSVVTINGFNFTGATSVKFGDFEAASFTVVSDTQIKAVTGSGYVTPNFPYVPITVTSPYGTGSKDNFIYLSAVVTELCPPSASTTLTSNFIVPGATYHWQVNTGTSNYAEVTEGGYYSGTNTTTLHLNNIPSSQYGYKYRCATGNLGSSNGVSSVQLIKFVDHWTGSVSTAWEDPANWSCGTVPDSGTDVVINTGAVIVLNSNTTIRSLTISPGASLTINPGFNLTILH